MHLVGGPKVTTSSETSKRSWPVSVKVLLVFVSLILLACGVVYVLGWVAHTRWTRYAEELRAAGCPLTFAEIEAKRTTLPADRNSALVINRLADRLNKLGIPHQEGKVFVFSGRSTRVSFFEGVPRELIDTSRRFLDRHRDLLAELLTLREMPSGRFDLDYGPDGDDVFSAIFPQLGHVRGAGKLAHLDGMLRLIDEDVAGAAEAARLQFAIGAALNEHPTLIGRLVQMAVQALAIQTVEDALRVGEWDTATLGRLTATVTASLDSSSIKWALWGERAFFVELCDGIASAKISTAQLISSDGTGSGGVSGLPFVPVVLVRRSQALGVEMYSWLIDAANDPEALIQATERIDNEVAKLPFTQFLVKIMLPSVPRAMTLDARIRAELRCAVAALAAEGFRMKSVHLPASLSELVPDFLDAVPIDPFNSDAMRFASTEKGIVIYSVGGDLVDDGGQVAIRQKRPYYLDVGFRLLKPEHRGLVLIDNPETEED